jgi:hypothetical protein
MKHCEKRITASRWLRERPSLLQASRRHCKQLERAVPGPLASRTDSRGQQPDFLRYKVLLENDLDMSRELARRAQIGYISPHDTATAAGSPGHRF